MTETIQQPVLPFDAPELGTIQARFEKFDRENPRVYELYRRFAQQLREHRSRCGISLITERIRWEVAITTNDETQDFKISNDYRSRYARKLMAEVPELRGFFVIKQLRTM